MSDPAWEEQFGRSVDLTPIVIAEETKLFEEGVKHDNAGRLGKALACFEKSHELGYPYARQRFLDVAFELSKRCLRRKVIKKNKEKAIRLLEKIVQMVGESQEEQAIEARQLLKKLTEDTNGGNGNGR